MDSPQHKEIPLHSGVLSGADTIEEIEASNAANRDTSTSATSSPLGPEGVIETGEGNVPSGIIGNGGQTESPEQLSNDGGVG